MSDDEIIEYILTNGLRRLSRKEKTIGIIEVFALDGYTVPDDWEYVNKRTKIPYICPKGHKHSILWGNWNTGSRCGKCNSVDSQVILESFSKEGYIIPDDWEYISKVNIPFTCPKGHKHSIRWGSWNKGNRCGKCNKLNTKDILESFSKEGYIIPDDWEYHTDIKIPFTCPKGHDHNIMWNDWDKGSRCKWCIRANTNLHKHYINPDIKIWLYWIEISNWIHGKSCYKFGITNKDNVLERFKYATDNWDFDISLKRCIYGKASDICLYEQSLLYRVQDNRAKWVPPEFNGSTECFELPYADSLDIWESIVIL